MAGLIFGREHAWPIRRDYGGDCFGYWQAVEEKKRQVVCGLGLF